MKKIENKKIMMFLGMIICWIIGAIALGVGYLLIKYLLIKYLSLKLILYIFMPFIIGFAMCSIWYTFRKES